MKHKHHISKGKSKTWLVTNPKGNKITVINLHQYCKQIGLDSSKMSAVASGIRKHHKGYFCERVGT